MGNDVRLRLGHSSCGYGSMWGCPPSKERGLGRKFLMADTHVMKPWDDYFCLHRRASAPQIQKTYFNFIPLVLVRNFFRVLVLPSPQASGKFCLLAIQVLGGLTNLKEDGMFVVRFYVYAAELTRNELTRNELLHHIQQIFFSNFIPLIANFIPPRLLSPGLR